MPPSKMADDSKKRIWAWAFYDWANSAFATTVIAGFFPVFFKRYWDAGAAASDTTFRLGVANSVSSLVIVLLAPVLGAIADAARARKRFLAVFASLGVLSTTALFFVGQGDWFAAATLFALGSVGFMGGNVFYDSLLVGVAKEEERDRVSAFGYALGYLGGGLLFLLNVAAVLKPELFGLADKAVATRLSFLSVAIWWAVFSVPLFIKVPEPGVAFPSRGAVDAVRRGLGQLKETFSEVRRLRITFIFLLAYWLYIDGVDTIVRMAVDYGMSIGLADTDLIVALLITQFVGFPAALFFGYMGTRLGAKSGILVGIVVYCGVTFWASRMQTATEFYVLAGTVGLVQGGVQALSRSLYTRLIPGDRVTEFFGFYNLLGKFAAIIGPTLVGTVGAVTNNPRLSILSVLVLFVAGGLLLLRVDVNAGARAARELEKERGWFSATR